MSSRDLEYSEQNLTEDLQGWWNDQVEVKDDPFAVTKPSHAGTIFDVVPVVDSLGAVTALITIEKHVGFAVPARVIKRGGYGNFAEMLADLLPKVRAIVVKKRKEAA